jgi:DNA-binding transcriptional ArsR family regulator
MVGAVDFAALAAALGDATRCRMLAALMDGRALTAGELAIEGDVSASTASSHLSRLREAGIVELARQGRHRYFRIADAEVASTIESLMALSTRGPGRRTGPVDRGLRAARSCYDHLAGAAGVRMLETLRARGFIRGDGGLWLTPAGREWCEGTGLDLAAIEASRRPMCRACLDWSERREHLAGALGAALLQRMLANGQARRIPHSRALALSARGERFIAELR